jgi:tol-pal system protein YbgF
MFSMNRPFLPLLLLSCLLAFPVSAQPERNYNRDDDEPQPLTAAPPSVPANTDLQIRMNTLENLVRAMTGQVEKMQFQVSQHQQQMMRMGSDFDVRFRDMEQRLAAADAQIRGLLAAQQNMMQQQANTPPPLVAAPPPAAAAAVPAHNPENSNPATATDAPPPAGGGVLGTIKKDETGKPKTEGAQGQYDEAFQALRQARYDDAERLFKSFLKANPKNKLTENAKYWLAETYYVRAKFSESAVAFAEAYEEFPKGGKAPDNLLKLAMSLGSLGKKQDACLTLGELEKRFPQASSVTKNRADQQKKTLGCS